MTQNSLQVLLCLSLLSAFWYSMRWHYTDWLQSNFHVISSPSLQTIGKECGLFQETFSGEKDCMTSPKNVCVGD